MKAYLEALNSWRVKNEKVVAAGGKEAALDVPLKAWEEIGGKNYRSRKNGLGESLPNFCLKIPTGGGKTLLAAHTVDLVNRSYRQKQTGLVLWVMPTTQIYRQTIEHLDDRDHPYRQVLDIASGGRTVIYEKDGPVHAGRRGGESCRADVDAAVGVSAEQGDVESVQGQRRLRRILSER